MNGALFSYQNETLNYNYESLNCLKITSHLHKIDIPLFPPLQNDLMRLITKSNLIEWKWNCHGQVFAKFSTRKCDCSVTVRCI